MLLLFARAKSKVENKGTILIRNIIKIASITTLLPTLLVCLGANAAVKTYENTWFEIEVILFSQLGDKSLLQEAFPETSHVPTPTKIIDLLGPYLDPNIASLKSILPHCKDFVVENKSSFTAQSFEIKYLIKSKDVVTNKAIDFIYFSDLNNNENTAFQQEKNQKTNYSTFNFSRELCAIPEAFFDEYRKVNPHFYYNETPIANIPFVITGEEDLTTDKAYLISQESLQLQDIVNQLKRSRNFKPMLHMGWRQITKLKKDAASLKIYAGENLMLSYNEAMALYNRQQNQLAEEQVLLINHAVNSQALIEQEQTNLTTNELTLLTDPTQHAITSVEEQEKLKNNITNILQEAKTIQHTLGTVLDSLHNNAEAIVTPLTPLETLKNGNNNTLQLPQMPPQPWSIDGFLKVEVGHFLHVTADLSIINMSLAEQATRQLVNSEKTPLKSIRLEQNKRVRSKEIHYFDHPYMGIIVQIRRHDQVAPIEEVKTKDTSNKPLDDLLIESSNTN